MARRSRKWCSRNLASCNATLVEALLVATRYYVLPLRQFRGCLIAAHRDRTLTDSSPTRQQSQHNQRFLSDRNAGVASVCRGAACLRDDIVRDADAARGRGDGRHERAQCLRSQRYNKTAWWHDLRLSRW